MADLLTPYVIKGRAIKNRLVFPPVVCFNYAGVDGLVTERNINHYEHMAKGGTGLIVVEATCISSNARLKDTQLGIWDDSFIPGMAEITKAIHKHGAICFLQIHQAGVNTDINSTDACNIFSASDFTMPGGKTAREATIQEIEMTIEQYANAALRACKAGFDGIEIHGAHYYLISQFLSGTINKRQDEYGKDRWLFGLKVIQAIKKKVPDDFIISMRLGANDDNMADAVQYARIFEEAGVDMFNVSYGCNLNAPEDMEKFGDHYSWIAQLGMNIKKHVNVPVICIFGIDTPELANEIVENGLCDFAASAKGLMCDADWILKYISGDAINPCLHCKTCQLYKDTNKCPARKCLT